MEVDIKGLLRIGRYQWVVLILTSLVTAPGNFINIGILFLAPDVGFSCQISQFGGNFTQVQQEKTLMIETWPECKRPKDISSFLKYNNAPSKIKTDNNELVSGDNITTEWVKCENFTYDHSLFTWTLTEKFNLVCDREWLGPLMSTVYMIGLFVGGVLCGTIADRFGRKKAAIFGLLVMIASNILGALAPFYSLFCVARFFAAIADTTVYNGVYVISMEILRKEERILAICIVTLCWVLSACTMAGVSCLLPNYEHALFFLAGLSALMLIVTWICIPESPRWLCSRGRTKQADKVIRLIAKFNGQDVSELHHLRRIDEKESESSPSPWVLLKTPIMRKRTIVQWLLWLSSILVNYGILYNLGDFGNDIRQSTIFSSLLELPGWILVVVMMDKIGRQISQFTHGILAGICFLATAPLLEEKGSLLLLFLALLGKACAANQLTICFTHTPELYPTQCRSIGLGTASTIGRIGGMVAPLLAVFNRFWKPALPVILGTLSIVTVFLVPFLPDTTSYELPVSTEEGEKFLADHTYKLVLPPDFKCCGRKDLPVTDEDVMKEPRESSLMVENDKV